MGLKSILLWSIVGYFLTDVQIAVAHFEIDNFKPDDNGYKHHLIIAKYGFKYEQLVAKYSENDRGDGNTREICAPGCHPCMPCEPSCSPTKPERCAPGCHPCTPCSPDCSPAKNRDLCAPGCHVCTPCKPECTPGKNELCAPGCHPCTPCSPQCSPNPKDFTPNGLSEKVNSLELSSTMCDYKTKVTLDNIMTIYFHVTSSKLLAFVSPVVCYYIHLPIAMGFVIPLSVMLNSVSGSGAPDYYAHHDEKAPRVVKLAQQLHLMMTPETHEKHHKNPHGGYAYFSPITNIVLDNSGFWNVTKSVMEWYKNIKAVPVPVPLFD
ncbi:unnamed protein product [Rotaria sp. Silwood2]|nr:unnamed protein product [Rotaria sp. Silwood2]CAF2984726.1 unnamed protein product [Rotaria sp. Silwood2]CAF3256609.1 unnamed protein product [Rotaria sp. Silwood2]CAF4059939.1 unnamed protein product [Rotaria sp. Silwood2]CAF4086860.1 unnamed protein product [Rotaria sp. Silwood2]